MDTYEKKFGISESEMRRQVYYGEIKDLSKKVEETDAEIESLLQKMEAEEDEGNWDEMYAKVQELTKENSLLVKRRLQFFARLGTV